MKLKQLVVAGLLVSSASLAEAAAATEEDAKFIVEDIKVEGLQRVALGAALTYLPVQVGDQMNSFRIAQLIRALYSSSHFEDIEILRDNNILVVRVKERPTISNIIFEGNDDIKDEQLSESLEGNDIRVGEPLDKTVLTSIENGLKDFFYSIGKYNADVTAIVTPLPRNRVDLKLLFEEGDAAKIEQINIVGNEVYSDGELFNQMELKFDTPWWDFMSETRYQKQTLSGDMETLTSYYMDRGYLRFSIDSTQVSMTPEKSGIYITMNVSEGEQYKISDVELVGDLLGNEEFIESALPLVEGRLYSQAEVTYTEEFISKYLGRFGYAYPTVTTVPDINDEDKTVKLTLSVDPGKRINVRRVFFEGNTITSDEVLRHNVIQMEGTWLSNPLLESSKNSISRLTYMDNVDYEVIRLPGEEDKVDVKYSVTEKPSGSFTAGVGYGDRTKLSLQAGISQDNFLGTGKRMAFNINTVSFQKSVSLSYTDPYFTVDGISLGGSLSYSEFDAGNANLIQYNSKQYSLGANVGYPIDEFNRITFGLTYSNVELAAGRTSYDQTTRFYNQFLDPNDPDAPIDYQTYLGSVAWSRSTLNRGLFPTAGSSQSASFSITTPNSDVNYFKTIYDGKFYFPLSASQRWSFLARVRLGYGNGYSDINGIDQILPFTQNFTAGGSDTLRGFENNTVGPRGVYQETQSIVDPNGNSIGLGSEVSELVVSPRSLGGNAMAVGGIELIVPTPFIEDEYDTSVRSSFFVDIGNVWDTEFDYDKYKDLNIRNGSDPLADYSDWKRYRASAGLSVQWLSPMGPMVFSFSRALSERDGDDMKFFSFNIGQTF
ncbi:outer membrane protein assembly factor BamA [Aestuariibacter sp. AA17]|uniref:Outer membrane protein assembly factor BamA n=1 Tax=Fluctibacter corallii TaxID=2984329 RepID=A0ABT3A8J5_9ALTE|nr:outer membrane protein assembly factor BamA [Aestuariibacter sp. AA17]MCV2884997.1 outer membrane protein assembly factor BamA [Aestuariibacter sp. AA17]